MEESGNQGVELCHQNGVFYKSLESYDCVGVLSLVQYGSAKFIEWRAAEVNVDGVTPDKEWALVCSGQSSRHRSNSECSRVEPLRLNAAELRSFKVSRHRHGQHLTFALRKERRALFTFIFLQGKPDFFVKCLLSNLIVNVSRRDKNLYFLVDESQELQRSFAELNLFEETTPYGVWSLLGQFRDQPYETTMGAFSKITEVLLSRPVEEVDVNKIINNSLKEDEAVIENISGEEYEVINSDTSLVFPPRPPVIRGEPLSADKWASAMDMEGRIKDPASIKSIIFHGGVEPSLRCEVWPYLLGFYPWYSTRDERMAIRKSKINEYYCMKQQWQTMSNGQVERFSLFRAHKSLIDKDTHRTDRELPFFAGDDNPNVDILKSILMTYVMYNFDLGYEQGMSDLLSPILQLVKTEPDAFWYFVGFMERTGSNFDKDQAVIMLQFQQLHTLLSIFDPQFGKYLDKEDSGNMFFCFRWLLILFKREFSEEDIMRLWEVFWSDLPCPNFHLLFAVAILDSEKDTLYKKSATEILKQVNELSMKIDLDSTLSKAEGLYAQLLSKESDLPDAVRIIIGLEPFSENDCNSSDEDKESEDSEGILPNGQGTSAEKTTTEALDGEVAYERGLNNQYL